jgi:hypothetical protein
LSQRDVAGSVWRFCRAAQFPVVGTAGAIAAEHREAFQRISIPGQGEDVVGDQGSAKVLMFDLSIPPSQTRDYRKSESLSIGPARCTLGLPMPAECQRPGSGY